MLVESAIQMPACRVAYYSRGQESRRLLGLDFIGLHGCIIGKNVLTMDSTVVASYGLWVEEDDRVEEALFQAPLSSRWKGIRHGDLMDP
jgi:hypothetical protein